MHSFKKLLQVFVLLHDIFSLKDMTKNTHEKYMHEIFFVAQTNYIKVSIQNVKNHAITITK